MSISAMKPMTMICLPPCRRNNDRTAVLLRKNRPDLTGHRGTIPAVRKRDKSAVPNRNLRSPGPSGVSARHARTDRSQNYAMIVRSASARATNAPDRNIRAANGRVRSETTNRAAKQLGPNNRAPNDTTAVKNATRAISRRANGAINPPRKNRRPLNLLRKNRRPNPPKNSPRQRRAAISRHSPVWA